MLRNEAIGVNFVDTMFRDGTFKIPLPFSMGVEAADIVEEIGLPVENLKIGDRVSYFFAFGAYADRRVIDARALIELPDDISSEQAAGSLAKGLRTIAKVPSMDAHTLSLLIHPQKSPVGLSGLLRVGDDGGQEWTAQ